MEAVIIGIGPGLMSDLCKSCSTSSLFFVRHRATNRGRFVRLRLVLVSSPKVMVMVMWWWLMLFSQKNGQADRKVDTTAVLVGGGRRGQDRGLSAVSFRLMLIVLRVSTSTMVGCEREHQLA